MMTEASSFRQTWSAAGGSSTPYMMTSCFFALGDGAAARMRAVTERYFTVGDQLPPPGLVNANLSQVTSDRAIVAAIDGAEEAGYDEVVFIATTDDVRDLEGLAAAVAARG
jgi:hypothetical protein